MELVKYNTENQIIDSIDMMHLLSSNETLLAAGKPETLKHCNP